MLIRLLKYLRGYLRIEIQGFSPERFLNLCTGRKILLWNISKEDEKYYCNISIKNFLQLKQFAKKTQTHIHITEKHGLAFLLKNFRHRTCFFAGILLTACILTVLSFFIWDISISGNSRHSTEELLRFLESREIYPGKAKMKLDNEEIVRLLRTTFDDITWVSAKIKGTRLYIELREATQQELTASLPDGDCSDLVAPTDGTIVKIVTRSGTPLVKKGESVSSGAILVSGRMDICNDEGKICAYQYCHADADIYLRYESVYQDSFSLLHEKALYTGKKRTHFVFSLAGKTFTLGRRVPFEKFDTTNKNYPLKLFSNFYLPLSVSKKTYCEYRTEVQKYTSKEALLLGKERFNNFCKNLQEKGVQIVENNVKIKCDGKNCFSAGTLILTEKVTTRNTTELLEPPKEDTENE